MLSSPIRIVVIDDHLVTCEGIIGLLSSNPNLDVVGKGSAGEHVLQLLRIHEPDILLVDLQMPLYADDPQAGLFEPISTLETAIEQWPKTAVVVITQEQDVYTISSLAEIGVKGYFLKSDQLTGTLGAVMEKIHAGGTYFSPAVREIIETMPKLKQRTPLTKIQLETLRVLLRDPQAKRPEQANWLHISPTTLQKRIRSLFETLDVPNVESCLLKAMRMGLDDNANGHAGVVDEQENIVAHAGRTAVSQTAPASREGDEDGIVLPPGCNNCGSLNIVKNGLTGSGKQKYSCKACGAYGTISGA
ncbi:MAG: response regulator [Chloroflexota bacterium]